MKDAEGSRIAAKSAESMAQASALLGLPADALQQALCFRELQTMAAGKWKFINMHK